MSLIETVVLTVLGGLVAGLVGYIGTIAYLREERKKEHLKEHKRNLETVSKALDGIFKDIWIFGKDPDVLTVPRPPFGDEKRVANIDIRKEPVPAEIASPFSGNRSVGQAGIDNVLYEDISPHFPQLFRLLNETEKEAKNNGIKILRLLNLLSDLIYKKLDACDLDFPYLDGSNTEFKKFRDFNNEILERDYAGSVFLFVIGEDEDQWSNRCGQLERYNIYDGLKKLAQEIRDELGEDLKQLLGLRNTLIEYISECKEEINKIEHTTKLKGSCSYL